jgi:prophage maintenance system killer protein
VARLFLADNGYALHFDKAEAVLMMEQLAAGTLSEAVVAKWFRSRLREKI